MNMSEIEKKFLEDICIEHGVSFDTMYALLIAESEVFYSNESRKNSAIHEMVNLIEFWSKKDSVKE